MPFPAPRTSTSRTSWARASWARACGLVAGIAALLSLPGCSSDWRSETYPVTGSVMVNGEPAEGLLVHLHSAGDPVDVRNSRPWGQVQEDGSFTLTTYSAGDGAPEGTYDVTLVWPEDSTKPSFFDYLDRRYASPGQSQWQVTVTPGENELPPLELEGIRLKQPDDRSARSPNDL